MKIVIKDILLKKKRNTQNVFDFHNDLPFLPERKKIAKYKKFVCRTHDKQNYVVYIRALKQALNYG